MNEIVLINMLSEIDPSLLQDDYIEKDMKKGFLSFLFRFFKKTTSELEYNSLNQPFSEEEDNLKESKNELEVSQNKDEPDGLIVTDDHKNLENVAVLGATDEDFQNNRGLSISIFKKNFHNLIKIISGIVAAFILVIGILVILIKHHKTGAKLYEKKIQIIY
jgi:hypothetical protein